MLQFDIFPQFLSNYEIRKVRAPTLFLSGLADQLIPPRMMMELYQVHVHVHVHVGQTRIFSLLEDTVAVLHSRNHPKELST